MEQRVTPLELFFDLVFVFAITQVTAFLAHDPTWIRLLEGLAILAVLWWTWVAYAWLGNTAASDEGATRVVMLVAMGAMIVVSLAVPHAFGADGLAFGIGFFIVRSAHLLAYYVVARDDPALQGVVTRLAVTIIPAASLIVLAGALEGSARALCWILALAIDYGGLALRGTEGWRVVPGHFAERHGLIVIIALGESIASLSVGAAHLRLGIGTIAAALVGGAVAAAMWWAYFDFVALAAERRFREADPLDQVRIARDSYSYLHLPMVAGVVVFALGVKKTLGDVGGDLQAVPAVALCCGPALYFFALSAFRRRNIGAWNRGRLVVAAVLAAFAPLAMALPALLSLAFVALVACTLVGFETVRYAGFRDVVRHGT